MYGFRVAYNTICLVIRDVCAAIQEEYQEEVIATPTTPAGWRAVADQMTQRWQFHHCIGALDGKHVALRKPHNAASFYYNYKNFHSIVLLGLVDAEYKFLWADVGANGACSDAQIWDECELKVAIQGKTIGLPDADFLPNDDKDIPYFIVGDDAFPLRTFLMKPYARRGLDVEERIFNYRASRCRRVSENAFGLLANRFACLLTTIKFEPTVATDIVIAAIICHNLMRMRYPGLHNVALDREDGNRNVIPGSWRLGNTWEQELRRITGNTASKLAKQQREYLKHYYSSEAGSVPWQNDMI
jgi:hypothetical protein